MRGESNGKNTDIRNDLAPELQDWTYTFQVLPTSSLVTTHSVSTGKDGTFTKHLMDGHFTQRMPLPILASNFSTKQASKTSHFYSTRHSMRLIIRCKPLQQR